MRLADILRAVDHMYPAERLQLRKNLNQVREKTSLLTLGERAWRLNATLDAMGDGLSQAKIDNTTAAMTGEYIEAWNKSDSVLSCA